MNNLIMSLKKVNSKLMNMTNVSVKDTKNDCVIFYLYVDDTLVIVSNDKIIKSIKNMLN